jgi:hypothetical protein
MRVAISHISRSPIACLLLLSSSILGQSSSPLPANAWLRTPASSLRTTGSVSQSVRASRDQYFDTLFGAPSALTATTASWAHIGHEISAPDITKIPEIPQIPDRVILTGTFAKFESILSQSQRSIYTEVGFSVDRVLADPKGQLARGVMVTAIIPGGTVQIAGDTLSYLVDPEDFFIQPQKRYLLVLSYHSDGDFYTFVKNWDLSDGVVKPNSKVEQIRAAKGKAILSGKSETQLPAAVPPLLSQAQ